MLRGLTNPKTIPQAAPSHEDLFMQRYERLLRAARRLTDGSERAQDLVHNAFVQFMLSRPEISAIQDLDGYLLVMIRNMNVSQARRAAIVPTTELSVAEYDSAEAGLRDLDAHAQLQVREELRLICQYACLRKERSKVGGALILRFFHGYYPTEVASIFQCTRHLVDQWLGLARREARAYCEDPSSLTFISARPRAIPDSQVGGSTSEFLGELRRNIFLARRGDCLSARQSKEIYSAAHTGNITTEFLSHVVSCASCLDQINSLLHLPTLAERFPMETFGKDPKPPGGSGSGGDGGTGMSGAGDIDKLKQVSRRRMTDVLEHRPQELRVAVNGYVIGSQSVSAEANKFALNVNLNERVGFVEVFSEQGHCLMFSNVGAPPDGPLKQESHVEFSEGRTLDLDLSFAGPWPTVNVLYKDPALGANAESVHAIDLIDEPLAERVRETKRTIWPIRRSLVEIWQSFNPWTFWSKPATVTALLALAVFSALVFLKSFGPTSTLTAAELLTRTANAEESLMGRADQVVHRTINLEERILEPVVQKSVPGAVATGSPMTSRRRIEIWHSANRGITARRLYDDSGQLIAGDWRRADGVQTIYHHGKRPQLQVSNQQSAISNDNVWQLSPSAKDFSLLVAAVTSTVSIPTSRDSDRVSLGDVTVQDSGNAYIISAESVKSANIARLTINKSDLHAIEMFVVVGDRQYTFIESSFERRSPSSVAPAVFEPEPVLLGSETVSVPASPSPPVSGSSASVPSPVVATPELELDVLKYLNQADAFYGEQITLSRTPEGKLHVQGIVETEKRKSEILQALSSVRSNQAVLIQVETVAEASARQSRQRSNRSDPANMGTVEVETRRSLPAEPELRAYFSKSKGLSGDELDQEVQRFATRVMARTRQARRHALALKQIAERFSADDLGSLDENSRAQWRGMMAQHARAIEQELGVLTRELQPVFPTGSDGASGAKTISGDADLARTARRLFEVITSVDEAVSRSFSIYAGGDSLALVKQPEFSRLLKSATSIARGIQQ